MGRNPTEQELADARARHEHHWLPWCQRFPFMHSTPQPCSAGSYDERLTGERISMAPYKVTPRSRFE